MNRKSVTLGLNLLIMVLVLTSCLRNNLSEHDIVGTWGEASYSPSIKDNTGCGLIEFFGDGKFEAQGLPQEYFIWLGLPPKIRVKASGKWELQQESSDPLENRTIRLIFDENPQSARYRDAFTSEIYLTTVGKPMLYADLGNLDDAAIFTQDRSQWCGKEPTK